MDDRGAFVGECAGHAIRISCPCDGNPRYALGLKRPPISKRRSRWEVFQRKKSRAQRQDRLDCQRRRTIDITVQRESWTHQIAPAIVAMSHRGAIRRVDPMWHVSVLSQRTLNLAERCKLDIV